MGAREAIQGLKNEEKKTKKTRTITFSTPTYGNSFLYIVPSYLPIVAVVQHIEFSDSPVSNNVHNIGGDNSERIRNTCKKWVRGAVNTDHKFNFGRRAFHIFPLARLNPPNFFPLN